VSEGIVWALQVRVTWEADDVERFTQEALDAGVDTIIAAGELNDGALCDDACSGCAQAAKHRSGLRVAGGDGSVNELASALVSLDAPASTAMAGLCKHLEAGGHTWFPLGQCQEFCTCI
jgi:diacylglycerol kinase family enzyme